LDDYENAIRHNTSELDCNLLAELTLACWPRCSSVLAPSYVAMDSLEAQESAEKEVDPLRSVHENPLPTLHTKRWASDIKPVQAQQALAQIQQPRESKASTSSVFTGRVTCPLIGTPSKQINEKVMIAPRNPELHSRARDRKALTSASVLWGRGAYVRVAPRPRCLDHGGSFRSVH